MELVCRLRYMQENRGLQFKYKKKIFIVFNDFEQSVLYELHLGIKWLGHGLDNGAQKMNSPFFTYGFCDKR